jgi:hypothetical protein
MWSASPLNRAEICLSLRRWREVESSILKNCGKNRRIVQLLLSDSLESKHSNFRCLPSKVYSAAVVGVDAFEVEIEVHAGWGPEGRISVVGLPDTAVKESRDRVLSA